MEIEELESQKDIDEEVDDDNTEGWIDEREEMAVGEREELNDSVGPLCLMLTKVKNPIDITGKISWVWNLQLQKMAYAIKNSTTIILPRWFTVLKDLSLSACMMPHDVSMR